MRRPPRSLLLFALFGALAASPDTVDRSGVHESSEVTLVQVPVWVTDREGKPVRGLSASDFLLEDEGRSQKLEAVDVSDLTSRRAAPGSAGEPLRLAGRRHFLLLFDLSYATPVEVARSREAAARFLAEGMDPDDLAAVGTISAERGARLLVTFTADRRQLVAAIRSLGLPGTIEPAGDPLAFAFAVPGDPNLAKLFVGEPSNQRGNADLASSLKVLSMTARKAGDEHAAARVVGQLAGLSSLARALDLVAGRKIVVYFSEGFDARLLVGNRHQSPEEAWGDNDAMALGQFWQIDVDKRYANSPLQKQLSETLALFRRSDCVIYPIDVAGLKAPGEGELGESRHGEDALFSIAQETGGELIPTVNDVAASLARISQRTSVTYLLSFRPSRRLSEGAFHRLRVRVTKPGVRVSARSGYYELREFARLSPLERSLSAAQVVSEERSGGFPMELLALPLRDRSIARVPVVLEVPGESVAARRSVPLRLGISVYAVSEKGEVEDYISRALTLDLRRASEGGPLTYSGTLRLLPGRYRIRALLRDEEDGRWAYRVSTVEVADAGGGPDVLTPLFLAAPGFGTSVREPRPEGPAPSDPFELAGQGFVPRLRPVLGQEPARLCLMFYPPPRVPGASDFDVEASVLDAAGRSSRPGVFRLLGRSAPDEAGLVKILAEFSPGSLPAGDYSLSIAMRRPGEASPAASARAQFRIR